MIGQFVVGAIDAKGSLLRVGLSSSQSKALGLQGIWENSTVIVAVNRIKRVRVLITGAFGPLYLDDQSEVRITSALAKYLNVHIGSCIWLKGQAPYENIR